MHFVDRFRALAQQETPAQRRQRMLPGALYGLTIAVSYAAVGSVVNQLSFPDLPVGVDWLTLGTASLFFAIWLGLGGLFINWFTQTEEGMGSSLLVMTSTALAAAALTFKGPIPAQAGKIFLLVLPVISISLLMTIILRWLGVRHAEALEQEKAAGRRRILLLIAIAIFIGGMTGFLLTRWGETTRSGAEYIHESIQTVIAHPSDSDSLFLVRDVPALESHLGAPYTLWAKPSGQSVVAVEVNVDFKDGYEISCILLVFPGQPPYPRACAEGEDVLLPPNG